MTSGTGIVPPLQALPAHVRMLLAALSQPEASAALDLAAWDLVVRVARSAQLLGTLGCRVEAAGVLPACPKPVRDHLRGAMLEARYLHQMARIEIDALVRALSPQRIPVLLLKGSSYVAADLPLASGRMLRDVDLLVPRSRIGDAERALVEAGWRPDATLDAYDQRYYRAWSHQIPPLRRAGHPLEIDVHHAILPPTGRIRPDAEALLRDGRSVGAGCFVPDPADQVVHAAVHLFQDSDCTSRLRDLVDIDALCRHHAVDEGFWPRLLERAHLHGAFRPVGYAVAFAGAWLGTPVGDAFASAWREAPRKVARAWLVHHAVLTLPPPHPDAGQTPQARRAARWMLARSLWLRMPPWLLAYHGAMKAWRALTGRNRKPAASAV